MKQDNTMTRTAIMNKLTEMGVPFKKKDSLQNLKDVLDNAMENETQKCVDRIITSMNKKEEEKNMKAQEAKKAEQEKKAMERKAKKAEKQAEKEAKKAEKESRNLFVSNMLEAITDSWTENYGDVVVASYEAKTSFAALKMKDTNRQVIKLVWTGSSVKLAFRVDVREIFGEENVKIVNYVMPYQITFKNTDSDTMNNIKRAFALAAEQDVKKKSKKELKAAEKKESVA